MPASITLYSYGFAFICYLLLAGALLLRWRNRALSIAVVAATIMTAIWAGVIAASTLQTNPNLSVLQSVELGRNATWLFLLVSIYGSRLRNVNHVLGFRRWIPWALVGISVVVIILFGAPYVGRLFGLPEIVAVAVVDGVWVGMSLVGLLLLENIYRTSNLVERWWVRYLCFGLGFLFIYDFMIYAEALVFRDIDPELWQSRGFISALSAPLLAMAVVRSRDRKHTVNNSRHVVFHTLSLMVAGVYLLVMAIMGYCIKYFGGTWGGVMQTVFLTGTGIFLIVLLFSNRMRALSQVWLSKNFFSYKFDYRQEWLQFTKALEEQDETSDTPQAIIQAMAKLAHCRAGLLWSRSETGVFQLESQWQTNIPEPIGEFPEFYKWLEESRWIIDVQEWRQSPHLYEGLNMPLSLAEASGSWLVVPLSRAVRLEGVLILRRTTNYAPLNWEDRDLLKVAGRQAANQLAQYHTTQAVVELRQFEGFSRLSAYVIHDLKNILSEQSLIVANATRHRGNLKFFDDVIETVGDSVDRMTRLMTQISEQVRGGKSEAVELGGLLREVLASRKQSVPKPKLDISRGEKWVRADRAQMATVLGHLINNAMEATNKHGRVWVRLLSEGQLAVVEIEDDGVGMSQEFIQERLFKPFVSTKGLTGMGIGAFESREYVHNLGGNIIVKSQLGKGSCFRVLLPGIETEKTIMQMQGGVARG